MSTSYKIITPLKGFLSSQVTRTEALILNNNTAPTPELADFMGQLYSRILEQTRREHFPVLEVSYRVSKTARGYEVSYYMELDTSD